MFTNFIFKNYINGSKLITKKVTRQLFISRVIEPILALILMAIFQNTPMPIAIISLILGPYSLSQFVLLYNEMSGNSVFYLAYAHTKYKRPIVYNNVTVSRKVPCIQLKPESRDIVKILTFDIKGFYVDGVKIKGFYVDGVKKSLIDIIHADGYYKKVELVETIKKPLNNRQKFSNEFIIKGYRLHLYDNLK